MGRNSITADSGHAPRCDRGSAAAPAVGLGVFATILYATLLSPVHSPCTQNNHSN